MIQKNAQYKRIKTDILERVIKERKGIENYDKWYITMLLIENTDSNIKPRIGNLRRNWKTAYHIDLDNLVQPLLFRNNLPATLIKVLH
ncbi:MAG: hypothetical protein U0354_08090 [Candidatus Sericytochromatia bacterium]